MRRLLAAALLAISTLVAPLADPTAALAAPAGAPVAAPLQAPSSAYMDQLLNEINARRAKLGVQPLAYAGPDANLAVTRYLSDLTPQMKARHLCFHGANNPVAPGWDYVSASGFNAKIGGEVLGCPGEGWYWTPQQIADGWWGSAAHFRSLYADPKANAVACGAFTPGNGGRGYETVACITYQV